MVRFMRVNLSKEKEMDKEYISNKMVHGFKVNMLMVKLKVMENIIGQIDQNMKDNGIKT